MKGDAFERVKALAGDSLKEGSKGWHRCLCPGHDDNSPSLDFRQGTDAKGDDCIIFSCKSHKCSLQQIADGWNVKPEIFWDNYGEKKDNASSNGEVQNKVDYFPTFEAALAKAKNNAAYYLGKSNTTIAKVDPQEPYRLNDRTIFGYNVRFEPVEGKKYFQPIRRVNDSKWFIGGGDEPWPPLYLPEMLATRDTLFICEGEKAAIAGRNAGLNTTAAQGGTGQFAKTDWLMLPDDPRCFLPDNDDSGEKFVEDVTRILQKGPEPLPITVHRIDGRPAKGGDLADLLELQETPEQKKEYADHVEYLASLEKPFHVSPIPPADTTNVEKSLLAAWVGILQSSGNISETDSYVNPEHFSNRDSKALAQALLAGDGQPLFAAVADLSKAASTLLDSILPLVGEAHLETFQGVAEKLSVTVAADYKKRAALTELKDTIEAIEKGEEVSGVKLRELAENTDNARSESQIVTMLDALDQALNPKADAIQTGMNCFDTAEIGGLPIGVTVLAAPPGCGKSAFALQLAVSSLTYNPDLKALWCLGEMKPAHIMKRATALWRHTVPQAYFDKLIEEECSDVTMSQLTRSGEMPQEAKKAMTIVAGYLKDRMTIWPGQPFSIAGIEAEVGRQKPNILVVDYLQLIQSDITEKSAVEKHDDVSARLVRLADQNDLAIIAISSLPKGADSKTTAGNISRGTAAFDYGASLMFLGSLDEEAASPKPVKWLCKKNRNGLQTDLEYEFHGDKQWFGPPKYGEDELPSFDFGSSPTQSQQELEDFNNG